MHLAIKDKHKLTKDLRAFFQLLCFVLLARVCIRDNMICEGGHVLGSMLQVTLTNIDLTGSHVGDEGMKYLSQLTALKRLTARGRNISGNGMKTLSQLTNLEVLEIAGTKMDDIGVYHMTNMTKLWKLGLCGTKVRFLCMFPWVQVVVNNVN